MLKKTSNAVKYPFDRMEVGQAFTVPLEKLNSIRSLVTYRNRDKSEDAKRFVVVKHESTVEVARVK